MDIQDAIIKFDALSQETRLRAFRLLVKAGINGLRAGTLSEKLGMLARETKIDDTEHHIIRCHSI